MAETYTYDATPSTEVMSSIESDQAESLAIGEEMVAQEEARLAGKYRDAQELEKAYMELEKKLGSQNNEESYEEGSEEVEGEGNYTFEDLMYDAGLEYQENGELSEEMLEAFSELSSRDLVEAYFELQNNQAEVPQGRELEADEVFDIQNSVGGEEQYRAMTDWAADNFSPEEVEAFDNLVESGNTAAIKLALQALAFRYTDAVGYEGEVLQGNAARASNAFRSQAELVEAMADPRYDTDPAYRNDILERLEYSDLDF